MNEQYWGLPNLAYTIRWLEELVSILSRPFLMVGFIVSMLDLLTHGQLLSLHLVYYGWAAIQSIAVDAMFFVTWYKVQKSAKHRQYLPLTGYILLGLALGLVAWAAMDIQSLEQALAIGNTEALARLNLNPEMLVHLRSLVAVIMGGVVAMSSPEQVSTSTGDHQPLRVQLNTWYHRVIRRAGVQFPPAEQVDSVQVDSEQVDSVQVDSEHSYPPGEHFAMDWTLDTGHPFRYHNVDIEHPLPTTFSHIEYGIVSVSPTAMYRDVYTPLAAVLPTIPVQLTPSAVPATTAMVTPTRAIPVKSKKNAHPHTGLHVVADISTTEQRIRQAYAEHPECSYRQLAKIVGCSPATAGKWKGKIEQEKNARKVSM